VVRIILTYSWKTDWDFELLLVLILSVTFSWFIYYFIGSIISLLYYLFYALLIISRLDFLFSYLFKYRHPINSNLLYVFNGIISTIILARYFIVTFCTWMVVIPLYAFVIITSLATVYLKRVYYNHSLYDQLSMCTFLYFTMVLYYVPLSNIGRDVYLLLYLLTFDVCL